MDAAYYEDLAGRLYGLLIGLGDRLKGEQALARISSPSGCARPLCLQDGDPLGELIPDRLQAGKAYQPADVIAVPVQLRVHCVNSDQPSLSASRVSSIVPILGVPRRPTMRLVVSAERCQIPA